MKRMTWKTNLCGCLAIATLGGALTACSTPHQTTSQPQAASPTATTAGNPAMEHGHMGGMSGMDHSMGMALGPADADFDRRFVDAMTPHHQGAVEMATEAQQKSRRPEIQKLAANMIKSQDQELAQMKQWRQAWYPKAGQEPIAYNAQRGHAMPMSQDQRQSMMMHMALGAADANFDLRFLNAMLPHHAGAVTMAEDALNKSKRLEMQKLAKEIITSQNVEISQMKQWRKAWYNK